MSGRTLVLALGLVGALGAGCGGGGGDGDGDGDGGPGGVDSSTSAIVTRITVEPTNSIIEVDLNSPTAQAYGNRSL